jgi:hypothetical protein
VGYWGKGLLRLVPETSSKEKATMNGMLKPGTEPGTLCSFESAQRNSDGKVRTPQFQSSRVGQGQGYSRPTAVRVFPNSL